MTEQMAGEGAVTLYKRDQRYLAREIDDVISLLQLAIEAAVDVNAASYVLGRLRAAKATLQSARRAVVAP